MAYKASDIAKVLIKKAEQVSCGEEFMTNMKAPKDVVLSARFSFSLFWDSIV